VARKYIRYQNSRAGDETTYMTTKMRFGLFIAIVVTAIIIGDIGTAIGMTAGAAIIWGIVEFVERKKASTKDQ
jgi:hypothetical protein